MSENKNTYEQISGHKECPKCGAANDPISSNCRFCQTSLPRIGLDALPEEILLQNCAIWIARLEVMSEPDAYKAAIRVFKEKNKDHASLADIIGNTDKYIKMLDGRAKYSPEHADTVEHFKQRQNVALKGIEEVRIKIWKKRAIKIGIILVVLGVMRWKTVSDHKEFIEEEKDREKSSQIETARLNILLEKANQFVSQRDYNMAKYYIGQLHWTAKYSSSQYEWDKKRDEMLSAVEKMSDNQK